MKTISSKFSKKKINSLNMFPMFNCNFKNFSNVCKVDNPYTQDVSQINYLLETF